MGPDLVLGHTDQACDDGHLLPPIGRKVLRNGNGLLDRGRLIAHPWWTGELRRLGPGVHTGGHDRTIPDHAVFVQCSKSRAGLRHERNPAHSDLWNGTKVQPGEVGWRRPLCQMLSEVFVHLEHGHPVFAEHGLELLVRHDLALVLRVLKLVLLDVVPHLAHHLSAGQRV
jgi:hypothetical protein